MSNMRAFEFILNGKQICIVAPEADGLVMGKVLMMADKFESRLHIGGVSNQEHLEWISQHLSVGDALEIRVVETTKTDPPKERSPYTQDQKKRLKRLLAKNKKAEKKSMARKRK